MNVFHVHTSMTACPSRPGFVFPTTAGSKAQMVCDGILQIDQMKDYMSPMRLLVRRLGTGV